MKSRVEACKFLSELNFTEDKKSFEEMNDFEKQLILSDKESLGFYVYMMDDIGDEMEVGNYSVLKSGIVICEIDDYIESRKRDLIPQIQNVMLDNGLRDIMNLQLNDDELFRNLLGGRYIKEKDESRYERANKYINEKGIEVDTVNLLDQIR